MDIFSILTSGTKFDKKKFKKDVDILKPKSDSNTIIKGQALLEQTNLELPTNLDFFNENKFEKSTEIKNIKVDNSIQKDEVEVKPINSNQEAKAYRLEHKIKVYGQDIPFPVQSFQDLIQNFPVPQGVVENLKTLPYKEMTPIQMQSASIIIKGRDLIACAPTGTGKTMAFAIPLLCKLKHPAKKDGYRSLILSPTRELARQIEEQFLTLVEGTKFKVELLGNEEDSSLKLPPGKKPKVDVLITTPLRLVYAIKEKKINLASVTQIILDEADKLFDFGFVEQIDEIINACTAKDRRIALFSATITGGVEALASTILHDFCRVVIGNKNGATELINQSLLYCKLESGKRFALRNLLEGGQLDVPCLIFVQSTDRAKQLYGELAINNRKNLLIDVIHAARPQAQREQVISKFLTGQVWILICTDVMARGVDFKGVKLVINYDLPQTIQSYVHRIGRTGRAGRPGKAITLFTDPDRAYLKSIVNVMQGAGCPVEDWMLKLSKPGQQAKFDLKRKPIERDAILPSSDKPAKKLTKEVQSLSKHKGKKEASKAKESQKPKSEAITKTKPKSKLKPKTVKS